MGAAPTRDQGQNLVANVKASGGLPATKLVHPQGSEALIYHHGATVTSFKTANKTEVIFVSSKAIFDGKKPIRGGIPIIFPKFGDGLRGDKTLFSHGFARRSEWMLVSSGRRQSKLMGGIVTFAMFQLDSTAVFEKDHASPWLNGELGFRLQYTVELSAHKLRTALQIKNTHKPGQSAFEFQTLLHTYYAVKDIASVSVKGLRDTKGQQAMFLDKLTKSKGFKPAAEVVKIDQEVDRIFTQVSPDVVVQLSPEAAVGLVASYSSDAKGGDVAPVDMVVWNPWVDKSKRMGDFADDEYQRMLCVEPGKVAADESLGPGQTAVFEQVIDASKFSKL